MMKISIYEYLRCNLYSSSRTFEQLCDGTNMKAFVQAKTKLQGTSMRKVAFDFAADTLRQSRFGKQWGP